mgnify:CR=1 FL=1
MITASTLKAVTLETYDNKIPETIKVDLKYKGEDLPEYLDYVFIKTKVGNVRKSATGSSRVIYQIAFNEKLPILEKIDQKGTGKQLSHQFIVKREFSDLKK